MTIGPGTPWGDTARPENALVIEAADDAALANLAFQHLQDSKENLFCVQAGDVLRTLGLESSRSVSEQRIYGFDLGLVRMDDGDDVPFVAHVIARRKFWNKQFAVVMNVAWQGKNYFGPKAHPNDGLLDVTTGALGVGQRILARKRLQAGSHLPHPDLRASRVKQWAIELDKPTQMFVDGRGYGRAATVSVSVVPDAFKLVA